MRWLALLALAACGGNGDSPAIDAPPGLPDGAPVDAPMFDPLVGIGTVELVQDGYMFTEGPQWREAQGDLVFSDIDGNTIYRYTPGGGAPVVHVMPSNRSNGLAIDGGGALIAAEHQTRRVTRDGTPIATTFEAKQLNSPNDVIVADDGTIYFTDPPYGIPAGQTMEQGFCGVFRLASGVLTAEYRGPTTSRPNGIGISPDGKTVYVADTADGKVYRFAVGTGGALEDRQVFVTTQGNPDGLAIDTGGNLFVTTSGGVEVFSPTGTRWGNIATPMQPANCAFGDADHQTLYITARTAVYRVRLANPGLPRR